MLGGLAFDKLTTFKRNHNQLNVTAPLAPLGAMLEFG
ncbi:hypothetical protein ACVIKO_000186 [Rhizobium ruizarguesonis]